MAREQARNGWLTNNQYLAILANPDEYQDLMVQALPTDLGMILNLQEGTPRSCRFSWRCMSFFLKKTRTNP